MSELKIWPSDLLDDMVRKLHHVATIDDTVRLLVQQHGVGALNDPDAMAYLVSYLLDQRTNQINHENKVAEAFSRHR